MGEITLKYLTELDSATNIDDADLFHMNQDGNDMSIAASVMKKYLLNYMYPVGIVSLFAISKNPNDLFPETTWKRVPGEGRTIRIANDAMSDVLQIGGEDTAKLSSDNMPSHNHGFSGNTSNFDHGTRQTSTNGQHAHNIPGNITTQDANANAIAGGRVGIWTANKQTTENGGHIHTVQIGSHAHSFSGSTGYSGGGQSFSTKNQYINLIAWYRIQ